MEAHHDETRVLHPVPVHRRPDPSRARPSPPPATGRRSGPGPADRARPGSRHHVLTDGQSIALAVSLTGGNRNDVTQLPLLLDKDPAVASGCCPGRRPGAFLADRGNDQQVPPPAAAARHAPGSPPNAAGHTPPDCAFPGTWPNAPSPGCTASAAFGSEGNDATTSTKPSPASPPA
ncbi:transposase [Streptomyces sp. NPDC091377]|uniref:transposase n=1 Tax=Streptomyces sp. NPDC091377 TaxID=3365995 RepID=UPI00382744AE